MSECRVQISDFPTLVPGFDEAIRRSGSHLPGWHIGHARDRGICLCDGMAHAERAASPGRLLERPAADKSLSCELNAVASVVMVGTSFRRPGRVTACRRLTRDRDERLHKTSRLVRWGRGPPMRPRVEAGNRLHGYRASRPRRSGAGLKRTATVVHGNQPTAFDVKVFPGRDRSLAHAGMISSVLL
jgi:hypothetical protein